MLPYNLGKEAIDARELIIVVPRQIWLCFEVFASFSKDLPRHIARLLRHVMLVQHCMLRIATSERLKIGTNLVKRVYNLAPDKPAALVIIRTSTERRYFSHSRATVSLLAVHAGIILTHGIQGNVEYIVP